MVCAGLCGLARVGLLCAACDGDWLQPRTLHCSFRAWLEAGHFLVDCGRQACGCCFCHVYTAGVIGATLPSYVQSKEGRMRSRASIARMFAGLLLL